jgi:hypothetical protein
MSARRNACIAVLAALAAVLAIAPEAKADPVYVDKSTTTKTSPAGQPASEYRPPPPPHHTNPPPPPARDYNPQHDPDVERGYQEHQRAHGR